MLASDIRHVARGLSAWPPTIRCRQPRGEWYELPADARPFVRAQLIERRLDGATSDDVLLVRPKDQPRTEAWLLSTVRAAAAKTHLRVLDEDLRHRPSEAERWLLERGVTLEWIPRRERSDRLSRVEDPAKIAVDVRAALVAFDEAAPCACSVPHHPVPAAEFTGWPPVPKRAHTQFDTGSRRNANGRRRDRPA
jgi:hypothetical protein